MTIEFKEFAGEVLSFDDKTLTLEHFISTEMQDSGGDVMIAEGMKARGNIVVLFQHGLDPVYGNEPIAKCLGVRAGVNKAGKKGLIAKTQYFDGSKLTPPDNTGEKLYMKDKSGVMPNWSIGFEIIKSEPCAGGRKVTEWLMHEYSKVAIGMNLEATSDFGTKALAGMKFFVTSMTAEEIKTLQDFFSKSEPTDIDASEFDKGGMKPYPNEHACRLAKPIKGAKVRRSNGDREHEGKKYDVIFQEKKGGTWEEQAYRYPKTEWTAEQAKAHCEAHDGILFEPAEKEPDKAADPVPEVKGSLTSTKVENRSLKIIHRAFIEDLKCIAEKDDFSEMAAEKCAKAALKEYSDSALPHVEKYIKAVSTVIETDPSQTLALPPADDDGADDKPTPEDDAKGMKEAPHKIAHRGLKIAHKEMIEDIHGFKGKPPVDIPAEAKRLVEEHEKVALPIATRYACAWASYKSCGKKFALEIGRKSVADKVSYSIASHSIDMIFSAIIAEVCDRAGRDSTTSVDTIIEETLAEATGLLAPYLSFLAEDIRARIGTSTTASEAVISEVKALFSKTPAKSPTSDRAEFGVITPEDKGHTSPHVKIIAGPSSPIVKIAKPEPEGIKVAAERTPAEPESFTVKAEETKTGMIRITEEGINTIAEKIRSRMAEAFTKELNFQKGKVS